MNNRGFCYLTESFSLQFKAIWQFWKPNIPIINRVWYHFKTLSIFLLCEEYSYMASCTSDSKFPKTIFTK